MTMELLELHAHPLSPPSRAMHMALDLLGLEYKYVEVDVLEGATRNAEFLSMNPQHTVPVLTDGNLVITESRAAMTYLVRQHKPDQLYPACAKKRSQIDQRLYFNIGTFYQRMGACVYPVCFDKTKTIPDEKKDALKEALIWTNQMVALGYVLGNSITIADLDFMATYSTLEACNFMDLSPYKNLQVWADSMRQQIPKYKDNCGEWAAAFGEWFNSKYSQ